MQVDDVIRKAQNGESLSRQDLLRLLDGPPDAPDSFRVMAEAHASSRQLSGGQAEVHAQLALNLSPCPCDCAFCSFAGSNRVFAKAFELSGEQAVAYALEFEAAGANAIYLMTTANYPFGRLLEMGQELRRNLDPGAVLVANVGDRTYADACRLRDAGFAGVYHALRLREGVDSQIPPEQRRESIRNFHEAGLKVGTCVEPIGPEHTSEEIADLIAFTASIRPAYSGAARRIPIPGTRLATFGMISELRLAQIVAIARLALPGVVGHCTHEPCTLGAIAGANLFWAEVGANPRDTRERTEEGRGGNVETCRSLFWESGWDTWRGPSRFFAA
jgi:biotin synthase